MSLISSCSTSTKNVAVKMPSGRFESKFEETGTCLMWLMKNCLSWRPLPANSLTVELTDCGVNSLTSLALKQENPLMKWGQPRASFLQNASITCPKLLLRCVNTMQDTMQLRSNFACANTLRLQQTMRLSEMQRPSLLTFKHKLMRFWNR